MEAQKGEVTSSRLYSDRKRARSLVQLSLILVSVLAQCFTSFYHPIMHTQFLAMCSAHHCRCNVTPVFCFLFFSFSFYFLLWEVLFPLVTFILYSDSSSLSKTHVYKQTKQGHICNQENTSQMSSTWKKCKNQNR